MVTRTWTGIINFDPGSYPEVSLTLPTSQGEGTGSVLQSVFPKHFKCFSSSAPTNHLSVQEEIGLFPLYR